MSSEKSKAPNHPGPAPSSVDTHFHVFDAGQARPGARYTPAYAATGQAWQDATQSVGVTHGVLVQTSFMGTDNRLLLAELAQHPDALRGVAVVAPEATAPELALLQSQGVRGIRLNLAGRMDSIGQWSGATALWDALIPLGWHVELHTDAGGLPLVLDALPQALPVVVDHFGKPHTVSPQDPTVKALQRRRQVGAPAAHIKLSAAYRLQPGVNPDELAHLWLGELGQDALLWGSDWPCTNHEAQADYAALHAALNDWLGHATGVVEAARAANPMRLYFGDTPPTPLPAHRPS